MKRSALVAVTSAALVCVTAASAAAAWTASASGGGTAGRTAQLSAPGAPGTTATPTAFSGVSLSWTAPAQAPARASVRYHVQRVPATATAWTGAVDACGSTTTAPITGTSCTDEVTAGGSYRYRAIAALGTHWREEGPTSASVSVPWGVRISAPTAGQTGLGRQTTFTGTANPAGGSVTVNVYAGSTVGTTPVRTVTASPESSGGWSVSLGTNQVRLDDRKTYTVQATQVGSATSAAVTFTTGTGN